MRDSGNNQKALPFGKRRIALLVLVVVLSVVYLFRLANLQIAEGASYAERAQKRISRSVSVSAPRGEIYDRYGRAFVKNRMGFSVQLDKVNLQTETQNQVILNLLEVLDAGGYVYEDNLPITAEAPFAYLVSEDESEQERLQKQKERFLKARDYEQEVDAETAMADLIKRYKIGDEFTSAEQRRIAGMRYDMEQAGFSLTSPYTVMTDVDISTVTILREQYENFQGVTIDTQPVREYVAGSLGAHFLGTVGKIGADEVEEYKAKGYLASDTVGKGGIEQTMEEYLRGYPGTKVIEQNSKGKVTDTHFSEEPQPGNSVMLTIDKNLQQVAEQSLEETINRIAEQGKRQGGGPGTGSKNGWDAEAGSCVVLKVDTGEVLVDASYPTYNPATYNADFNELNSDPRRPLLNRTISGAYEPGSTFKMATALAVLEEGVATPSTKVLDLGIYRYSPDYQPACWLYTDTGRTHGNVDVVGALKGSCNYYFYEMGRQLGITKLGEWCQRLGMGQKTGIELPGERAGTIAGPIERDERGETWWDGDTLQAAIGQSDNLLTPLQLANYVATIVNGGTRYQPTLLRSVRSYVGNEEIKAFEPTVVEELGISETSYNAIMAGMGAVTEDGTASSVFGNYPIKVGGKTGTASVPSGSATGVFVAFAPFDNPEIAVAIVIEHGAHGNYAATVARDIFDQYFGDKAVAELGIQPENELAQ